MEQIIRAVIERLAEKGMPDMHIPTFIRSLGQIIGTRPGMTVGDLNRDLDALGWDEFELDVHTLCMILAVFKWDESSRRKSSHGHYSRVAGLRANG
jgi:hypothetical protein